MKIHFIAIGGSAMHNLAIALKKKDYLITGSDDVIYEPSRSRLESHQILPETFGWYPERITKELDAVILGMHAKIDNPELLKAQELGVQIYSYPEFLYNQSKDKTRVVIGGSHGKTTITSMILHVLHYHNINIDFMVGAQLEGFDTMVHLTDDNEFMLLEGDEYLSSPIDRRSKFLWYKPNIALVSGIAWDHINVFPTYQNYKEQFSSFIDTITSGGILVYNQEDDQVCDVVESTENSLKKYPYSKPKFSIQDGVTIIETPYGKLPLSIFGDHNLSNLAGAKWICQHIGVNEDQFYDAIASFKGASKRLQQIFWSDKTVVFKDFAHSPSKVLATTNAVKQQFSNKRVIALFELHTFSSLNSEFLKQYKGALDAADQAIVFYSKQALESKNMQPIEKRLIEDSFGNNSITVLTSSDEFNQAVANLDKDNAVLLFMSSGNYSGFDFLNLTSTL